MPIQPRKKIGQNILKFSIRKLTIGVTSAVIGAFILGATPLAQETVAFAETNQATATRSLTYHYVSESELTPEELNLVQAGLPKADPHSEQTYYFVYRGGKQLPATGDSNLDALIASIGGIALLIVAVKVLKGNKKVMTLVLVSALGQSMMIDSASAVQPALFSHLSQSFILNADEAMPTPVAIEGYQYVGYIVETGGNVDAPTPPTVPSTDAPSDKLKETVPPVTQPETPGEIEIPKQPEVPTEPEKPTPVPEQPEVPKQPEVPTTPEPPAVPEEPEEPGKPETPEEPTEPEQPVVPPVTQPETPGEIDEPEEPKQPEVPTTPEPPAVPEEPEEPGKPETPEEPTEPEQPVVPPVTQPETPGEIDEPQEPKQPEVPTTPEPPAVPEEPEEPGKPETPEEPTEPVVPPVTQPETPGEIDEPQEPKQPEVPTTPAVPEVPAEPEQPVAPPLPEGQPTEPEVPEQPVPNKDALIATINESASKVATDYSASSWRAFEEALEASKATQGNPQATQEQINESLAQLTQALANLSVDKTTLNTLIQTAGEKVQSDYSPATWESLNTALANATVVNEAPNSKQSEIDSAQAKLSEAINGLSVDKTALSNVITEAQTKVASDYSPATWQALNAALKEATTVNDALNAKQSEVDAVKAKLATALSNLAVEKSALQALITSAQSKVQSDFSSSSWQALEAALSEANAVNTAQNPKQSEIDSAQAKLSDAIAKLNVDKSVLNNAISDARTKAQSDYSSTTWQALNTALTEAEAVNDTPASKQSEVDAVRAKLTEALNNLGVDASALSNVIALAQSKEQSDYSPATWQALNTALTEAMSVQNSPSAKQTAIDSARAKLAEAIANLAVDKSELNSLIATARGKVSTDYSSASWQALNTALTNATAVNDAPNAKQSAINTAKDNLSTALLNLAVEKGSLQDLITLAQSKVQSDYSPATWESLNTALANATAVNNAPESKQSAIDSARATLSEALSNLGVDKAELNSLIATARSKVSTDYSSSSWQALNTALTAAEAVNNSTSSKQSAIESARAKLSDAISKLNVDKTALNSAITEARAKVQSDYSPATWQALETALSEANSVNSAQNPKQSDINSAQSKLSDAIAKLNVDKSMLNNAISEARAKVQNDYSPATWQALNTALTAAEAVNNSTSSKQSAIDLAQSKLSDAIAKLNVDKSALNNAISEARAKVQSDYSAATWQALNTALTNAISVNDASESKQSEINTAKETLATALSNLTVEKGSLQDLIALAQSKVQSDYSPTTWRALNTALTAAEAVNNSTDSKQSAIDSARATLSEALSNLGVDKAELNSLIATARGKVSTDYSSSTWQTLNTVLTAAEAVNNSTSSKQSAIDSARATLSEALSNLGVDKAELNSLIATARGKVPTDYSQTTWQALNTALTAAEAVNNSTNSKQSAIDSARTKLSDAISKLNVDKSALQTLIAEATSKESTDYSPATWRALETALSEANSVNSAQNPKQSDINSAQSKLSDAIAKLSVDKAALNALITTASGKVSTDYSSETWHVLSTVLQEATGVYGETSAKQSQVNAAMLALSDALKQLNVNKAPLEAKIAEQQQLDSTQYTTASWQRLTEVIANANRVKNTPAVKQSALNAEEAKVAEALTGLQRLRTQPTITLTEITKDELAATATITHNVVDPDSAYVRGQVNIYKDGALFKQVPIIKGTPTLISELTYNTPYELETVMIYDVGNGEQTTIPSEEHVVELNLKKIALKDAKSISLFGLEGNEYHKVLSLSDAPTDLSHYYVVMESHYNKAWRLPVKAITEENVNGETVYRVTVAHTELVQEKGAAYETDYSFHIAKHAAPQANVYTSFATLLDAMKLNPTGHFALGADISAAGVALATSATSYMMDDFRGQLSGESNGKQFAIFDLAAPLFNNLVDATVRQLDLKQVNIATLDQTVGALAKKAVNTTIEDVAAEGTVIASRHIGGLIGKTEQSHLRNVAFEGTVQALSDQDSDSNVGGLVGEIFEGSITKGYVDATLNVRTTSSQHRVGMIVGRLHGSYRWADITQVYAKGTLTNSGKNGQVGGLIGSAYANGRVQQAVSEVEVKNGNTLHGDTNYTNARVNKDSVFVVDKSPNAVKDQWTTYISSTDAQAKLAAMNITATTKNTGALVTQTATETDYSRVADSESGREIAYYNMAKLMPFYNKEYLVRMGNTLDSSDNLYSNPILSIIPRKAGKMVAGNTTGIDQIWILFADGTLEKYNVSFSGNFGETGIAEYAIEGTTLLYTPEWFQSSSQQLAADALALLAPIEYAGQEVWTALDGKGDQAAQLEALYLKDSFNAVKSDLANILNTVLGTSSVYSSNEGVLRYIEQNKAELLLGLAYVNRWYNIDFADTNIKDLAMYRQDFFGRQVDTLQWLVNVGSQGFQRLNPINNHELNPLIMGVNQYVSTIRESLEAYRYVFANDLSESDWFKSATKAYVSEGPSYVNNQQIGVSDVYEKLAEVHKRNNRTIDYRNMLLPLLTMSEEGVYIIPTMSTITFGSFDKYIDMSLKARRPETYAQKVAELKAIIDREAAKQGEHFAAWYRIALPSVRDKLLQGLPVWDSLFNYNNTLWSPQYGENAILTVREFFGPTGNWRDKKLNAEAYSNGTTVVFELVGALDQNGGKGSSIFTHEQVHNFDNHVYLGGFKRRPGHSAESFAEGLLQAPRGDGNRIRNVFGFNLIHDGESPTDYPEFNATPQRFQSTDDLQTYMHGVMDVVYLLDYAEAEAIRSLPKDKQRSLITKLAPKAGSTPEDASNRNDYFRNFTNDEWNALNLNSINDFIDNGVALRRFYRDGRLGLRNNEWDAYVKVPLFTPFYSLEENTEGTSGGYTFRRTAFELLAHKGYEHGFLPYITNQYAAEAQQAGVALSDSFIVQKVFDGEYDSLNAFKKAMFQERIAKLDKVKAVNAFELQVGREMKRYNLTSFESIQQAITEVTQYDATHGTTYVSKLKEVIFTQYMKQTNEFRDSIFNP